MINLDYTPAFSRLAFTKKPRIDLLGSSIPDARCHLAKCLQTLTSLQTNQVCYNYSMFKNSLLKILF